MRIIRQGWSWNREPKGLQMLKDIELAGRTCYKSEEKIVEGSAEEFVSRMIKSGHHAMIEFAAPPPVKVVTDRGVTHEIVRHRLFSYAQESTRYCNYSKGKYDNQLTIILPVWFYREMSIMKYSQAYSQWESTCQHTEEGYLRLIELGQTPQEARSVLPNSLKTEINIRGNVREWRHFFKLRCSNAAHPQMKDLARSMLRGFQIDIPVIFDDITY